MNQPPPPPPQGPYGAPGGFGPPTGYAPPPGGYNLAPPPPPPPTSDKWVVPLLVIAGPGNVIWLVGVGFGVSSSEFKRNAASYLCAGLAPHALFTALFAWMLSRARPQWHVGLRIAAGSYLTSGLAGWVGLIATVLVVGLVAAACGACKR